MSRKGSGICRRISVEVGNIMKAQPLEPGGITALLHASFMTSDKSLTFSIWK